MAAIVASPDEKAALRWAVDNFRDSASDLTIRGSRSFYEAIPLNFLIGKYVNNYTPEEMDRLCTLTAHCARGGDLWQVRGLCEFAAMLIERGDQLPEALRSFVAEFLRGNIKTKPRKPGPNHQHLIHRDAIIGHAVLHIVREWRLEPTRNQVTQRTSAAAIVREALKTGANLHLTEAAINKIWNKFIARLQAEFEERSRIPLARSKR